MTLRGIDTSTWQSGLPDAAIDADFIIVKATEGVGYTDADAAASYEEAKSSGKLVGSYDFARPDGNDPVVEADYYLGQIQNWIGESIMILDWEHTPTDNVYWAKAWIDRVISRTGITPMIYMNESTANAFDWSPIWDYVALWVAKYADYITDYNYDMSGAGNPPNVNWPNGYAMWQWTSSGRLEGYGGNLDCNIFYGDSTAWRSFCVGHPVAVIDTPNPTTPAPVPTPDGQVIVSPPLPDPVVIPPVTPSEPSVTPVEPETEQEPTTTPEPTTEPTEQPIVVKKQNFFTWLFNWIIKILNKGNK